MVASIRPLLRRMPPLDSQRHVTASSARSARRREIEAPPNMTVARVGPAIFDAVETGGEGGGWVGEGGGRDGEGGGVDGDGWTGGRGRRGGMGGMGGRGGT